MKLIKLTKSARMAERYYAELENGERLSVDLNAVGDLALYDGRELGDEELASLRGYSKRFGAKERALRLLEKRQMSRRELIKKLVEKGEDEKSAEYAADLMERIGAINDREYAGAVARHYKRMGYGSGRVRQELLRRGIDRELWAEAIDEAPENSGKLDALLERKLRNADLSDRKEVKKATDMLLRRGFSWSEIKEALGRYTDALNDYTED
ncbi:MAG: regulatory protein RecX [Oscillospiraceae bacterium]|nr:regulatory protein RecX [Oscillospiraceae bacterium]